MDEAPMRPRIDRLTNLPVWRVDDLSLPFVSCLLLIDLDRLKELVNDRAGHEAGDRAISTAATAISWSAAAVGASAYRSGGDEFVVVGVPTLEAARELAQRIREAVGSELVPYGGVTASVGVAHADGLRSSVAGSVWPNTSPLRAVPIVRGRSCRCGLLAYGATPQRQGCTHVPRIDSALDRVAALGGCLRPVGASGDAFGSAEQIALSESHT